MNKLVLAALLVVVVLSLQLNSAFANYQYIPGPITTPAPVKSYQYNPQVVTTTVKHGDKILLIVANWPSVVKGYPYIFQTRVFDESYVTYSTPRDVFWSDQGDINNATVNVTLLSYDNKTVVYTMSGNTNQFGWTEGILLTNNLVSDQVYHVVFTASHPGMVNQTKTFPVEIIDSRQVSH